MVRALALSLSLILFTFTLHAATPTSGTISALTPGLTWQGATFAAAANAIGSRDGCFDASGRPLAVPVTSAAVACDVFTLNVALDPSYWTERSGGVIVKINGYGPADD